MNSTDTGTKQMKDFTQHSKLFKQYLSENTEEHDTRNKAKQIKTEVVRTLVILSYTCIADNTQILLKSKQN